MLNINTYEIKAKYIPTGRLRTVKVEARTEADAIAKLSSDYTDVKSVTMKNRPPTERQIDYAKSLGIVITNDMCFEDVSALISSKTDDKLPPKQGLIDFADAHDISFSSYAGKKNLYIKIFQGLPQKDAVAFFIFSVYRHLSDDRESNLDKSPHRDIFYDFASSHESDDKFVKSLYENYYGADLRFFGTLHTVNEDGESWHDGGNARTYAFKCAKQYLIGHGLVSPDAKVSKSLKTRRPKKQYLEEENYEQFLYKTEDADSQDYFSNDVPVMPTAAKSSGAGCLLPVVMLIALLLYLL